MEEMITISKSEYEGLKKLVHELQAEIALLKHGRDSNTSSTPPSQDIGRSNRQSLRTSNGKKSGGQRGHRGHHLSMVSNPDEIISHVPEICIHCGKSLDTISSVASTRRQVIDIPRPQPVCTEHRSYLKICPCCGTENRGVYPESVKAPVQYGNNIKSAVAYLSVYQYMPYKRITEFLKTMYSLTLSQGSIDNILEEMSRKSQSAYEEIRKRIASGEAVGADETGCRVNGHKHWFHVWQTKALTYIVSFASRGHKVIEEYFPDSFLQSFYVSDCWASQLKVSAKRHQLCIAHLLRELLNFEKSLNSKWSVDMKNLLYRAMDLKKFLTEEDYKRTPASVKDLEHEMDCLLSVDFSGFHAKKQALIKRLIKHRNSIFTFLYSPNVPPDNNASERAIRNVKVKTKVSGMFRNDEGKGADRFARIRSIIDTTIKNGQEVFPALECLAKCRST